MPLDHQSSSLRRPVNLSRQVHDAISHSIVSGTMKPGERIVVEHTAQRLGVSQTPVREALGGLIGEGLVTESGNGRFQVVELSPEFVSETFLVRSALEGLAAELAAKRMDAAQIAVLVTRLGEVDGTLASGRTDVYSRFDDYLHRSICEAAGNQVLARELAPLQVQVDLIRFYSRRLAGEHIGRSHREHGAIVEALQLRKPATARSAMETHIRKASERIEKLIDFHALDGILAAGVAVDESA